VRKFKKIFIAGHKGMVGSAILRYLIKKGEKKILTKDRSELDLTNQVEVRNFFLKEKPDQVYLAAAKAGGIKASVNFPAEFIYENLAIQTNVIHAAFTSGIKKILFLGSSCIYPKNTNQPISEKSLLSGKFDPTNEYYSIAKVAGIKLCESYNFQYGKTHSVDYRSIVPTSIYGLNDNYDLNTSHVIPALIRKIFIAKIKKKKTVTIWGSGKPLREFLYVDDLAKACFTAMNASKKNFNLLTDRYSTHINVGSTKEISIKDLAYLIKDLIRFNGNLQFDISKVDGVFRKKINSNKIKKLGWRPEISLKKGLMLSIKDFESRYYEKNFKM
jgi:GDP-L-fucose synthase